MTLFIKDLVSIGAVDSGDNPEAEIVFWKRRKKAKASPDRADIMKGESMDDIDLSALPDDTRDAIINQFDVLKAERDAAIEAAKPEPEVEVAKALDDETADLIAKAKADADEARAELAVEKAKHRNTELVAKIKTDGLEVLLGAAEEVAPNLAALQTGAPEAFDAIYANLTAAAQRVDLAKALGEIGSAEAEATDPYTQRDNWVAKQLADNPAADVNKLRSDFWVVHPEAFAASRENK